MLNIIQTRSYTSRLGRDPNNRFKVCFQSRLPDLRPRRRRLPGLGPSKRLTARFEGIENVKNFDVEKWYNFNFLFRRKL